MFCVWYVATAAAACVGVVVVFLLCMLFCVGLEDCYLCFFFFCTFPKLNLDLICVVCVCVAFWYCDLFFFFTFCCCRCLFVALSHLFFFSLPSFIFFPFLVRLLCFCVSCSFQRLCYFLRFFSLSFSGLAIVWCCWYGCLVS